MTTPETIVRLLRRYAREQGSQVAFRFLEDGESSASTLSYRDLDREAWRIARQLRSRCHSGERVLLLFAPGLEYVSAFFGCLYAPGAETAGAPDEIPRRVRAAPSVAGRSDAGRAGETHHV